MNTRFINCEACGTEGRLLTNDGGPYDVDHGPCPVCHGERVVEIDGELITLRDLEQVGREGRAAFDKACATVDARAVTLEDQGLCEVTMTRRFQNAMCRCVTYADNLGPCKTFEEGAEAGHCVYCDHGQDCHESLAASHMIMDVADYLGSTLAKSDPRAWDYLLIYCPRDALQRRLSASSSTVRAPSEIVEGSQS